MTQPPKGNAVNDSITPVIVRIVMRYLSGALVASGLVTAETGASVLADPDVQAVALMAVGGAVALVTEWVYARARRSGGVT